MHPTVPQLCWCVPCCSNGDVVEAAVPHDGAKSSDTFELQVARQLYKVALPKTPGTYTHGRTQTLLTSDLLPAVLLHAAALPTNLTNCIWAVE